MCSVVLTSCCGKGYLKNIKSKAVQNYLLFVKVPYFISICQDISMEGSVGVIIIFRKLINSDAGIYISNNTGKNTK
jgi:hypothetical protein